MADLGGLAHILSHIVFACAPAPSFPHTTGQYGKVCGFVEPLPEDHPTRYEFANEMVGTSIPPEYYPACEKGFREAANAGALIGAPVEVSNLGTRGLLAHWGSFGAFVQRTGLQEGVELALWHRKGWLCAWEGGVGPLVGTTTGWAHWMLPERTARNHPNTVFFCCPVLLPRAHLCAPCRASVWC